MSYRPESIYRPQPLNSYVYKNDETVKLKHLYHPLTTIGVSKDLPTMRDIRNAYNYKPNWIAHNANLNPAIATRTAQVSTYLGQEERTEYDNDPSVRVRDTDMIPVSGVVEGTDEETKQRQIQSIMRQLNDDINLFEQSLQKKLKMPEIYKKQLRIKFFDQLQNKYPLLSYIDVPLVDPETGNPISNPMAKIRAAMPTGSRTLAVSDNLETKNVGNTSQQKARADLERRERLDEMKEVIRGRNSNKFVKETLEELHRSRKYKMEDLSRNVDKYKDKYSMEDLSGNVSELMKSMTDKELKKNLEQKPIFRDEEEDNSLLKLYNTITTPKEELTETKDAPLITPNEETITDSKYIVDNIDYDDAFNNVAIVSYNKHEITEIPMYLFYAFGSISGNRRLWKKETDKKYSYHDWLAKKIKAKKYNVSDVKKILKANTTPKEELTETKDKPEEKTETKDKPEEKKTDPSNIRLGKNLKSLNNVYRYYLVQRSQKRYKKMKELLYKIYADITQPGGEPDIKKLAREENKKLIANVEEIVKVPYPQKKT
jgi:galactitol-specific phosphotransferase system IIB component